MLSREENPSGLSSNNLLVVITRHFFFIVSFPRARVVTTHHLLHRVIQVHKAVGRVFCESYFFIFFSFREEGIVIAVLEASYY